VIPACAGITSFQIAVLKQRIIVAFCRITLLICIVSKGISSIRFLRLRAFFFIGINRIGRFIGIIFYYRLVVGRLVGVWLLNSRGVVIGSIACMSIRCVG
jgi:hypothetical protein